MSKIAEALKKVDEKKSRIISPISESKHFPNNYRTEGKMRKTWLTWGFIVVVVTVFVVLNYQGGNDAVPLSEIFPEEEVMSINVEYEFVEEEVVANELEETVKPTIEITPLQTSEKVAGQIPVTKPLRPLVKKLPSYTIQIASFKEKKRAEDALASIRAKVPSAYIASRDLGEKGVWYRVYAGQFDLRSDAEVSLSDIKRNYDSSFIISPKGLK